jgi:hypothetical protein
MKHKLSSEFYEICKKIVSENKSNSEWAAIESDDMFQTKIYEGGFDGTELEFVFSVFIESKEYWLHLSLEDINKIHNREIDEVEIVEADL